MARDNLDWLRICNHPLVQGLHRIITLIAAPLAVMLLAWAARSFDEMRTDLTRINTALAIEIPAIHKTADDLAHRVERLEEARQ